MSKCSYKDCDLEVFDNNNKCIFHCEKNKKNFWLYNEINDEDYSTDDYENAKERWNKLFVMSFWKNFIEYINNSSETMVDIKNFIFPIYWKYQYEHISIIEHLKDKNIRFLNCHFIDYIFLDNEEENQEINRISFTNNCIFQRKVQINGLKFKKGMSILGSTFKNNFLIQNCKFDYLFEIVNCSLNKLYIHNITTEKLIEIKYNTKNQFYFSLYSGNIKDLKIQGNNINDIKFENITIENLYIDDKHHDLKNYKFNKIEIIENSNFDSIEMINLRIMEIIIQNSQIDKKTFLMKSEINNSYFYNSKFFGILDLSNVKFYQDTNFKRCSIDEAIFKNCEFLDEFDLSESSLYKRGYFLGIKTNKLNRETARIIKDSFEQQNNIIEANKFYALEMKSKEKELSPKENFFEWLVFKIHGISSNHSQDWILALFWILSFTFTFLTIEFINTHYLTHTVDYILIDTLVFLGFISGSYLIIEYEKINKFWYIGIYYIFYGFFSQDWLLKCFSNKLNPFSIMTGNEELTFSGLIYKIIIAYLIYQLIISIRQNTRRK